MVNELKKALVQNKIIEGTFKQCNSDGFIRLAKCLKPKSSEGSNITKKEKLLSL